MSTGSPFIKAIGLMFYQPNKEATVAGLASRVHAILEGEPRVRDVQVQIILGQEELDLRQGGIVSWRMSKAWFEKMKAEKWVLAAYRTDLSIPGKHLDFQCPCTTDAPMFVSFYSYTSSVGWQMAWGRMIPFLRVSFERVFAVPSSVIFLPLPRFFFVSSILVPWFNHYLLKRLFPVFRSWSKPPLDGVENIG